MKTALATLQFLGYNVLALNYEENTTQLQQNIAPIELTPHFSRKILHVNDTIYAVIITIQIDQDNLPFKCQVSLKGTFNVNNIDNIDKCLQVNATAILFPYVRSTLSMLTTLAGKNPINLPTFNISKAFEDQEAHYNPN